MVANAAVAALMGATSRDLIGKTDFAFYQQAESRQYYADEQQVLQSGKTIINKEEVVYDPQKNLRWFLTTKVPLRDTAGNVVGIIGIGHDITERKQTEEQLLQLKQAVESMPLGVTITNLQGRILYTNPAEASMHGYAVDELLGEHVRIFSPLERRRSFSLDRITKTGGERRESLNIRKGGELFSVWLMSEVVRNAQ
jgi:PAS domain S-box-containing protein